VSKNFAGLCIIKRLWHDKIFSFCTYGFALIGISFRDLRRRLQGLYPSIASWLATIPQRAPGWKFFRNETRLTFRLLVLGPSPSRSGSRTSLFDPVRFWQ